MFLIHTFLRMKVIHCISGVTIVQKGDDLLGKERFVADGLSTVGECNTLIQLAKVSQHSL